MAKETFVELPPIVIRRMKLTVVGDSPLITHRFSEKAKKMMLDKQQKKAAQGREAKDPEQQFRESLYPHPDGGYGFPAVAFKAAAVNACRFEGNITMTVARGAFHIPGDLVHIDGDEPEMREDMVRIAHSTADIRYRGMFRNWKCTFDVMYNENVLSMEQIVNLFNIAGFGAGVGEWRPGSKSGGSFGMFHVDGADNE